MKTATLEKGEVVGFLGKFGKALGDGDIEAIKACWEVPAMAISDQGAHAIASQAEIEAFFAQAKDWYNQRGITSTRPEVEDFRELTSKLSIVTVRWPGFDQGGNEKWSERAQYVLSLDERGTPRIRVAIMLGGETT